MLLGGWALSYERSTPAGCAVERSDASESLVHDERSRTRSRGSAWPGVLFHLTPSVSKVVLPHKSVKSFFILVIVKDKLTDLWGS